MQGLNDYCFELETQMSHAMKGLGYLADCVLFIGVSILIFPLLCGFSVYLLTLPNEEKREGNEREVWEFMMLSRCHSWLCPMDYN